MDTKKWMNYTVAVLPMLALVLAGFPNAVTIYQMTDPEAVPMTCSFFTLLEDVPTGVCLPYAAIFSGLTFGLAAIWLVLKKKGLLPWIMGVSFAAMSLAVVPVLVGGDVMLVPNMLVPILLGVDCLLAFGLYKAPETQEATKGERLGK